MHVAGWKSDHDMERKLTASNTYLRMATIKKLEIKMADNGWLASNVTVAICHAKAVVRHGRKAGNWLVPSVNVN